MRAIAALLAICAGANLSAEDQGALGEITRSFEMPAHRSLLALIQAPGTELAPFETDGCSGGMSWSWRIVADLFPDFEVSQGAHPPWESCCVTHDRAYHNAGEVMEALDSYSARLVADTALKQCVADPGAVEIDRVATLYNVPRERAIFAYDLIADAMYNAVRFGGGPCSGLPWRWGYGYPGCVPGL